MEEVTDRYYCGFIDDLQAQSPQPDITTLRFSGMYGMVDGGELCHSLKRVYPNLRTLYIETCYCEYTDIFREGNWIENIHVTELNPHSLMPEYRETTEDESRRTISYTEETSDAHGPIFKDKIVEYSPSP